MTTLTYLLICGAIISILAVFVSLLVLAVAAASGKASRHERKRGIE